MSIPSALVTGGLGYVGSALVRALAERYPECAVTVLDIASPGPDVKLVGGTRYIQADITVSDQVLAALQSSKPTIVFHTAGIIPLGAARYGKEQRPLVWSTNVEGTRNLLSAAKQMGVKGFVYTSSSTAVMDDLANDYPHVDETLPTVKRLLIYGESKAAAEALVLAASEVSDLATCALRPPMIFGPGGPPVISSIHACIAKGETPFVLGTGFNLTDFIYLDNVVEGLLLAAENLMSTRTAAGEAIFISNNEPVPFRDFCLAVWANFGHTPRFEVRIPRQLAWGIGYIAEWATWVSGTSSTLTRGSVKDACATRYSNGAKAERILGYKPRVGLVEGLRISCEVGLSPNSIGRYVY
ncbi:MAG: hypothetical protein M1812_000617 [Candelaria pacifica]|nr:MAG: hypothetical protein M1812_000617 [Candelaria pacifica]